MFSGARVRTGLVVAVLGVLLIGLLGGASPASLQIGQTKPNIVLVLLDDARYDDLVAMPEVVDLIGDAGAALTRFYAPFPLCCPARATLLTGQYAHNHGVVSNVAPTGGWLEFNDSSTLATWLDPTYRTGLVGKYFNEYRAPYVPPGWDEWMVPRAMYSFDFATWFVKQDESPGSDQRIHGYQTDTMGDLASDFINRNAPSDEPFFLYTSIIAPHSASPDDPDDPVGIPTTSPKPSYRDAFLGAVNLDPSFNEKNVSDKPNRPARLGSAAITGLTEAFQQRREAELSAQDAIVQIINALEAQGELNDTYLVFMSDNGHTLGEHRIKYGKVNPYEVTNRVPMMVRGPGIPPGIVLTDATSQIDFAPTVLAMAGVDGPTSTIDGSDLLPLLTGTGGLSRSAILIEATDVSVHSDPMPWQYHGIVNSRWKYIERSTGKRELYDLARDPYELVNVVDRPRRAKKVAHLATLLDADRFCSGDACRD